MSRWSWLVFTASVGAQLAAAQGAPLSQRAVASAAVTGLRYDVTFTRATAVDHVVRVVTTFTAEGRGSEPVLLSLPAWTPGAYEISNFARWVTNFTAMAGSKPLSWDKLDYDTWRIRRGGGGPGQITVSFTYHADSLDNAMTWSRPDFLLFNGTNLFLYPEGVPLTFAARVTVHTEPDWKVTTSMPRAADVAPAAAGTASFAEATYHDLVDMPFFVGAFDVDSAQVAGKWMRYATYPAGSVSGSARQAAWHQIQQAVPTEVAVFGETPWDSYSVMEILDTSYQGASGLEHASSHVDVMSPVYVGSDFQPSLYAHEIFHAWNVKRLRPADMWPYRYDAPMPTPWLWVSEGITDYYADLAVVRGGVVSDTAFYRLTSDKINEVDQSAPVALQDASINTWIHPTDGTQYIYYPKGSLAGFMLDVMIRDASDNRHSLDDVMRDLYLSTYKQGRGFTHDDWWNAVARAAGHAFPDFEAKYVDGRESYPWDTILPLAGLRTTAVRVPRLGIATIQDAKGVRIEQVDPSGSAGVAGVQSGDYLLAINDLSVQDQSFASKFRAIFADVREGQPLTLRVQRGEQVLALSGALRLAPGGVVLTEDPTASAKAVRIRNGILRGRVGGGGGQ